MVDAPQYQPPPEDPAITALNAKAKSDDISALEDRSQIDTANIMARYGTRLAMAGAMPQGLPLTVTPPPVGTR
jgi:hypothetical protein